MKITLFGTQPYDRESFDRIRDAYGFDVTYHRSHLNAGNVALAEGADVVCIFVNDTADAATVAPRPPVGGGPDDLIAQRGPVQHALHTDQDQRLIVYKQDSGHKNPPFYFWLSGPGRRIVTVVPMSGSLSMLRP